MKKMLITTILVSIVLCFTNCDDTQESSQTLKVETLTVPGKNGRILSISSTKYYLSEKQDEVLPKLDSIINSGQYNISDVKINYTDEYMTAGDITYNAVDTGIGNKLRIYFIKSDERYWNNKDTSIHRQLNEFVNKGKYNILKVQTDYAKGYLIAAEVYYSSE